MRDQRQLGERPGRPSHADRRHAHAAQQREGGPPPHRVAEEAALQRRGGVAPRVEVGVAADPDRAVHAEGERRAGEDQARVGPHIAEQERDEGGAARDEWAQHGHHRNRDGRNRALEEPPDVGAVGSAAQTGKRRKPHVPHGLEQEVRHPEEPEGEVP